MSLCREWTLVKHEPETRRARPLKCRSWGCEQCRPDRKAQLLARAAAGSATRFLTLTVNPSVGSSPAERLRMLSHAWRTVVKRIRREHGHDSCEFLAVVEETKKGEPHLHILLRSVYLPQKFLSDAMNELISSPIVDIRKIRNRREVINYVAKYIAKAPAQFDGSKRYWTSKNWEPPVEVKTEHEETFAYPWQVDKRPLFQVLDEWVHEGFVPRQETRDTLIAFLGRRNW